MHTAINKAREAGVGVIGFFSFTIIPLLFLLPSLLAFFYVWDACLDWPEWVLTVLILLMFFGIVEPIGIAGIVSMIAAFVQGYWLPATVLLGLSVVSPWLMWAGMAVAGWAAMLIAPPE